LKIKIINLNTCLKMTESIGAIARKCARPGTEIVDDGRGCRLWKEDK
jgi:Asp/Glu/hydantoin racemase